MSIAAPSTDLAPWWRRGVVYQVYIRSFADGSGDGTGDIAGLRSRLNYLAALGVDAIWITPWYPSPLHDGGYDVADYRDICARFGTLAEAESLIDEAHELGIKVLIDLVPNHTSVEHRWFQAALSAEPGSAERDRYIFRRGKGPDGSEPPSNWRSVFGGPAWSRVDDGDWYLHLFDVTQPDLNWENSEVTEEFLDIFAFWLDRGVDGMRVDVAHGLVKDLTFPDIVKSAEVLTSEQLANHPHWDRDGVHDIIRSWRSLLDRYDDRMMVAEAWVHPERLPLYLRPDEYHQSFNFDLLDTDWDASQFTATIESSAGAAADVGATTTWVLSNHDVMRHATRYGLPTATPWRRWLLDGPHDILDAQLGARRARAAILLTLSLPGAAYLYQGEELGLPEVWDLPEDVLDDPTWVLSEHKVKGRDGCRVPIPWSSSGPSFGFGSAKPWLPQPAGFGAISVEAQDDDPSSMLNLYRTALALRKKWFTEDEDLEMFDVGSDVVAFTRGSGARCLLNMGDTPVCIDDVEGTVLLSSVRVETSIEGHLELPANAAVWLAPIRTDS
ncbi:MAG: glycoside hydrolase family 13 protein [Actinomycetia bacterium]|nr:glycoside hydrolase family 13 protein [Actinomycetes bacterium]